MSLIRRARWSSRCGAARSSAGDSGVAAHDGWGGFTLGYAVDGPEQVDAVCAEAAGAGASVTRAPVEKPFGYSGVFADPDGHTWEVAYIKGLALRDDGTVALGAAA